MHDVDILSLDSRKRIYDYVKEHPGTHLREIARNLDLPLGTALYHLDYLTTREVVVARQDGRYKRFFLANAMGRREKDHVTAFRHAVPRRVAEALLDMGTGTQRLLCDAIGVSRSTLSFHLGQMVADGLLVCEDRRPEKTYRLADARLAAVLLDRFGHSFAPGADPAPLAAGIVAPALVGGGSPEGVPVG